MYARDAQNTLLVETTQGKLVIEMRPDLAPNHVARIKELAKDKFYDGVVFHRVIEGFMAQTGDPTGTGAGGSGKKLKAEFSSEKHTRGTVSMARAADPDSADSQWFIVYADAPHLDNQYTIWGKVTEGMDVVDKIKKGDKFANGRVENPDKIITLRVEADAADEAAEKAAEKPAEAKPADAKADEKPADAKAEAKPVDTKPAANAEKPAEEKKAAPAAH